MEWTINLDQENRYAEIVTAGIADRDGSLAMAKAAAAAMSKNKIKKMLIDHRNIDMIAGSTTAIYQRPKEFNDMGMMPSIKVAEVVKPEHEEFFNFLATVCLNRGYRFSIFYDRTAALEWLLKA